MYANTLAAPDRAKLYPSDLPVAAARRAGERLARADRLLVLLAANGFTACAAVSCGGPLALPTDECSLIPVMFNTSSRLFI